MAIRLDIQDYCSECCDFEADVTKPERTTVYTIAPSSARTYQSDTIIRCKYAKRCSNLLRYLTQSTKGDKE